ncbi:MtnX-like HAD-IB family phosphatase [Thermomonas sp.]|uniref:MtnX-like HAD-IB family phosphatase n=1 Tax=Thermomonas sp. TaxID=1971895 RepID=UPI002489E00F|nr:MtnX-like HAD-IB family phosphatase [Thermomonas sp.]MDI1252839.1 MtnX-like HAD-IB family phosphatase [Thermomonas sp.]
MVTSNWTILCDFDGTVTREDVTDALLVKLGRPGWEFLEAQWRSGTIGSRECMTGQVSLLGSDASDLDAVIDGIGIDPGFPAFVKAARAVGMQVIILSDGLDYAIERILATHGIDPPLQVVANHLLRTQAHNWQLEFPHAQVNCRSGNCKCACAQRQQLLGRSTLLIGDGQSDVCVAGRADFVFAKDRLLEHCRSTGIEHHPITGFAEAAALLPALLAGELTPDTRSIPLPLPRIQYA